MFKFVAVSALALSLAACGSKEEVAPVEEAPSVEVVEETAAAESVPAEGLSAGAVPVEADAAADAGAVVVE